MFRDLSRGCLTSVMFEDGSSAVCAESTAAVVRRWNAEDVEGTVSGRPQFDDAATVSHRPVQIVRRALRHVTVVPL